MSLRVFNVFVCVCTFLAVFMIIVENDVAHYNHVIQNINRNATSNELNVFKTVHRREYVIERSPYIAIPRLKLIHKLQKFLRLVNGSEYQNNLVLHSMANSIVLKIEGYDEKLDMLNGLKVGNMLPICFILEQSLISYNNVVFLQPQTTQISISIQNRPQDITCSNLTPQGTVMVASRSNNYPISFKLNRTFFRPQTLRIRAERLVGYQRYPNYMVSNCPMARCATMIESWKGYNIILYHNGSYQSALHIHHIKSNRTRLVRFPNTTIKSPNLGSENLGSLFSRNGELYANIRFVDPYNWGSHQGFGLRLGGLFHLELGHNFSLKVTLVHQHTMEDACAGVGGDLQRFVNDTPITIDVGKLFRQCPIRRIKLGVWSKKSTANREDRLATFASMNHNLMYDCINKISPDKKLKNFVFGYWKKFRICAMSNQIYHTTSISYYNRTISLVAENKGNVIRLCSLASNLEVHTCFQKPLLVLHERPKGHPLTSSLIELDEFLGLIVPSSNRNRNLILKFWEKSKFCYLHSNGDKVLRVRSVTFNWPTSKLGIVYDKVATCSKVNLQVVPLKGKIKSDTTKIQNNNCIKIFKVENRVIQLELAFSNINITGFIPIT